MRGDRNAHILESAFCSATAAAVAEASTFPLDTIKTRLQMVQSTAPGSHSLGVPPDANIPPASVKSAGLVRTAKRIYNRQGVRGFYGGVTPAIVRAMVNSGMSLTLYKPMSRLLSGQQVFISNVSDEVPEHLRISEKYAHAASLQLKIMSGCATGSITQLIASPADVMKTRLQADGRRRTPRYNGAADAFFKILRAGGISSFWRGLAPSMQRSALGVGATIATYDHMKQHLLVDRGWEDAIPAHFASSALSGLCATLVTLPADVIKTRFQTQSLTNPIFHSTWHCFTSTVKNEGVMALYKGFTPLYLRLGPWQCIFFVCYESISYSLFGTTF